MRYIMFTVAYYHYRLSTEPTSAQLNHVITLSSLTLARPSHSLVTRSARAVTRSARSFATAFLSPPWRNTLILITASILIYPYLPSPQKQSASPSLSPEGFSKSTTESTPLVTRLLAQNTTEAKIWSERNDRHLELSTEKAQERLLFQEAERPRVHRMRYPR
jgi:hypothetical protein